ncbi:MAG: GatB/YqeY domain-containing protein [bacterium]|nr:GatB/YqeY domain-containing protein [bacterium]
MLHQQLHKDLISALKEKREFELSVLRMLSAALKNKEIEKRTSGEVSMLTEQDVIDVLTREAKKRREAAALFITGSRVDLADKERREVEIIQKYLPAQLSAEEIETVVKKVIEGGAKDFASAMRAAMAELKGKADGKAVGDAVKKLLAK